MITLLSRIFIKDRENVSAPSVRGAYATLCCILGIILNMILFGIKLFAGIISGAVSIMADAFNNLSDAGSTVVTLLGFKIAAKKPDRAHPFGHGRMEYISGLVVSMIIIVMGFELASSSFQKILHPEATEFSWLSVIILSVSILVKFYMFFYNRSTGKKISSAAMVATATDSISDCVSTTVVLACTIIAHYTNVELDSYCGLLVSLFIMFAGLRAALETIKPLLGEPPTKEFVKEIEDTVMSCEVVTGIHDLVVHDYGPGRRMISLHAEVPSDCDILEVHDYIDNIEHELNDKLGCEAVIHMDPVDSNDEETAKLKEMILSILKEINEEITIHDLRLVTGPTHTNCVFDMVIPFEVKMSDEELTEYVSKEIKKFGKYFAVVNIDRPYANK